MPKDFIPWGTRASRSNRHIPANWSESHAQDLVSLEESGNAEVCLSERNIHSASGSPTMKSNQRNTYRCASIDPEQRAVLKVGRKQIVVELVDQSMGGFAVRGLGKIRVKMGQVVRLRTSNGWSIVEVIHVSQEGKRSRIGLRRLDDLPDPRLMAAAHRNSFGGHRRYGSEASGGLLSRVLGLGLVAMAAFWITASQSVWLPKVTEWYRSKPWTTAVRSLNPGGQVIQNPTISTETPHQ